MNDVELAYKRTMLFDFYGELLTKHRKDIYDSFVNDDISLTELANLQGCSRQSVHDLIKRCDKLLFDYEEKLHLIEKYEFNKKKLEELKKVLKEKNLQEADDIVDEIIGKL